MAKFTRKRSGFSLVELAVVLTIILIIGALSAAAVLRYLGTQQVANTEQLLRKLQTKMEARMAEVGRAADAEPIGGIGANAATLSSTVNAMAGGNTARARVIWKKIRLKQAFPVSFSEALSPFSSLPALATFQTALKNAGVTGSSAGTQPYESSICLAIALQSGAGGVSEEEVGKEAMASLTLGTTQLRYFQDAWGKPLAFCRWPANSAVINPNGAQAGNLDLQGDPDNLLAGTDWLGTTGFTSFTSSLHPLAGSRTAANASPPNAPQVYILTPVVISAGPDGVLGLDVTNFLATTPAGSTDYTDDIYGTMLGQNMH
jgi:prepilin-type N-terminal cleavage/methylation domain-containing protein